MIIHTNSPVKAIAWFEDEDGDPVAIADAPYKCQLKEDKDSLPVITFQTGGGPGLGTILKTTDTIFGVLRDVLQFTAPRDLVANLAGGSYYGDVLRTDVPEWMYDFDAQVIKGVTSPAFSGTFVAGGVEFDFLDGLLLQNGAPYTGIFIAGGVQLTYDAGLLVAVDAASTPLGFTGNLIAGGVQFIYVSGRLINAQ
jgi:hypothetical protein